MSLRTLLALALATQAALTVGSGILCLALAGWPSRPPALFVSLAVAGIMSSAAALAVAHIFAAILRRPLRELRAAASSAAAGDLRGAGNASYDEAAAMVRAFNAMIEQVGRDLGALRLEKSTLESVLNHMSDALLILDPTGALTMVNPPAARIFGVPPAQALGRRPIEVIHHFELDALVRRVARERTAVRSEMEVHHPEYRVLRVQANPVLSEHGRFLGTVVVAQDITDLRRADLVRQEFVANVSHELRTPLASLRALAETLQGGAARDPEAGPRFLAHMIAELDRLTLLVSDLLDLSAIESGSASLRTSAVSVEDIVDEVLAKFQLVAGRRRISLRMEGLAGLPPVWGDEARLAQAISNLVDNAVKYSGDGGTITVNGREQGDLIALTVADTGIGIPAEHLPRIFERFYRVDRSRSRTLGGTGLGLSIVKHIATSLGGRIEVQSTEGRGSSFTLFLPRAAAGSAVSA